MDTQTIHQKAIKFAALKHSEQGQTTPGTQLPYVVHLSNVAMEILIASQHAADFDVDFAVQVALLHDVLEDTTATFEELAEVFGRETAEGVAALTKNDHLPREDKMPDSLSRTKPLRKEIRAVKLADRITNLQTPPGHWDNLKKTEYLEEAKLILDTLSGGNPYLENRLADKIRNYEKYIER